MIGPVSTPASRKRFRCTSQITNGVYLTRKILRTETVKILRTETVKKLINEYVHLIVTHSSIEIIDVLDSYTITNKDTLTIN